MRHTTTAGDRMDRLRLLAERLELDRLPQKTPAQLRRFSDLERLLESTRTRRAKPAVIPAISGREHQGQH